MDENTAATNAATDDHSNVEEEVLENQGDQSQGAENQGEQKNEDEAGKGDGSENSDDGKQTATRSEKREQNYIDKLSDQIRNSNQRTTQYNNELFAPKDQYKPVDYRQTVEFDDPKAYDKLEEDRTQYGQDQFNRGVQQGNQQGLQPVQNELWLQRLDIDSERASRDWDVLDESNTKTFDPQFASDMTQKFLNFIGYRVDERTGVINIDRPQIRYSDFVKAERQNLDYYAQRLSKTSTENIVKQAANTGVRPNGQARSTARKSTFDPNDPIGSLKRMSREEYENGGREESDAYLNKRLGISK
jgi:hypothetical protein